MKPAISVENLGKSYRVSHERERQQYRTLRESLTGMAIAPLRRLRGAANGSSSEEFWALKDVSFEIKPGEVVGIIGRNGAGKSTLLKILSRITNPTKGQIAINGRVGSLLEVGTGFHPELSGRENIYLNGSILGMPRNEIDRQFDHIVDFSGVEKFLDTPVKRYSSGMYVRLAFAVAAHLQPEILVIDEVLSVGDAEFQKKCLGKMTEIAGQGRTVLFVSHQLNAVQSLCSRAISLAHGSVRDDGSPKEVISRYLGSEDSASEWVSPHGDSTVTNPYFNPTRLAVVDRNLLPLRQPASADDEVGVLIDGTITTPSPSLTVGFALYTSAGDLLFWSLATDRSPDKWPQMRVGTNRLVARIPPHLLNEGEYRIELIASLHFIQWLSQPGVNAPAVNWSVRGGLSDSPLWTRARPGLNAPILRFAQIDISMADFPSA